MKDNFLICLEETLKWEGGYTNHPLDPGGPTNLGVIQERYDQYNTDMKRPKKSVKSITKEEAIDIYRRYYWNEVEADDIPSGLDLAVFDFGVNSGPSRANKYYEQYKDINSYMDAREKFLKSLSTFKTFGKGWLNRTAGIRKKALSMTKTIVPQVDNLRYRQNTEGVQVQIKKEVVNNSSKLSAFQSLRRIGTFLIVSIGSVFGLDTFNIATSMASTLKSFMSDYGIWMVLGTIAFSWLVLKWGEYKHIIDFQEGRYIPSGLTTAKAEETA